MRSYFLATHTGAELDLLLMKGGRHYGVEVKFQDAPRITPSTPWRTGTTVMPMAHSAGDPGAITPTTRGRRP
jgi:hypothetical protein